MANKRKKSKKVTLNKSENKMKKGTGFLIAGIVFFVLATVTSMFPEGLEFINSWNNAAAVGVIGGADGPTAIFLTSKFDYMAILSLVLKICCGVSFIIWISKNKKAD